jgi:hypothetical protein
MGVCESVKLARRKSQTDWRIICSNDSNGCVDARSMVDKDDDLEEAQS